MRSGAVLGVVCAAWLGAGCFSMRVVASNEVPAAEVPKIQPGRTTKSEILDWFGAPEDYTDPSGLRLEGVTTISEAEALRGLDLEVPEDARHPLKAGAYYMDELEGCEVVTSAGEVVGRVSSVDSDIGTPVLVVRSEAGDVLVPLAEEICRVVDPAGKRIVIDPPAGLIELNARAATAASEPRERATRPERGGGAPARAGERGPGTKSPEF